MRIKICLNYLISKFLAQISHVYACSILIFMQNYESKISVLRSLLSIFKSRIQLFPDVLNHFLYLITSIFSKTCFIFILPYLQAEKYINQQNPTVFFFAFLGGAPTSICDFVRSSVRSFVPNFVRPKFCSSQNLSIPFYVTY